MIASDLSLEQKVGQVFMLGFRGKSPSDAAYALEDLKAGGIIYFARNVGSVAETHSLSASLQEMAQESGLAPLFIATDQEGGLVSRLIEGLPCMPGPMGLGATGDIALARQVAMASGTQLRAAGVNMNLAPVLDVNSNPDNPVIGVRSFGEDPSAVAKFGRAAISGYLSSGVCPVGKHFPGHGDTSADSHVDLPVLASPMERLEQVELVPFRAAISGGLPAIMTAHIVFEAIDPDNPATMSPPVLMGLLRGSMGMKGLILTDCMEMQAVARAPGTVEASVRAFEAGADLILISHTRELQERAYKALLDAVRSGEIPERRLDESVERVLAAKQSMGLPNPLDPVEADTAALRHLSSEAHLRSIAVIRTSPGCFPLERPPSGEVIVVAPHRRPGTSPGIVSSGGYGAAAATALVEALGRRGFGARQETPQGFLSGAPVGPVVIVTENAWKDPAQASQAVRVLDAAPRAVQVAVRDPYDARVLPARAVICSFSPRPEAMEAVASVLTGARRAAGKSPVTLAQRKRWP